MSKKEKRKLFLYSYLKNRNLMLGTVIVLAVVLIALFSDWIAPYNFDDANLAPKFTRPCAEFPFGTDEFGRDMFSRVIYGSRIALRVAVLAMLIEIVLGVSIGLLSGYYGGNLDRVLSFLSDLTWSMPPIIMSMAVITVLGKSIDNVIIAIAVVSWAQYARVVRAKTQSLKNMAFVETGIAFNEKDISIMSFYILPNIIPPIIVLASLSIPSTIMSTTALSFLGLGAQPPSPDWGLALSSSMSHIATAPWLAIFPGIALVLTVFGFNLFGEGLRDLLDPRLKSR
ncbi:MAG: ABC transporter permease [Clostridiales bacterium]|jgi:peptide/nickel transport system permease protein|nr:ABC transporter permease [Clostridiales bacterium]